MANVDAPSGLKPAYHLTGGEVRAAEYSIADQYNTALYYGQLVKMTGTGRNVAASAGSDTVNIGVFAGCKYVNSAGVEVFSKHWPASTVTQGAVGAVAYVYDDPYIVYEIQGDEDLEAADIGCLADIVGTSGDATTGISTQELDSSSITNSGTAGQLRIHQLVPRVDNAYGNFAKMHVTINEHLFRAVSAAV